ncbi:hypothetical protein COV24_04560 [candidate division WWE3 bacterium CG10_big_fil_rev_8_21_14_0_10_32_10]|uniref:Asl1-like glycosyl hydrolase catalytic domain-containing protein n=1 Tax=candidate division WWE3 bacterium CG10_big_fil_rev_8_21_14_0_10_32_10 TaxID=1975090 RepID=A0A2H0RAL3_UNCKA|nr:MAG: hypothetical protein COV24_04560 [candidate division WWE3 bacterium CG10_big_fil_rev_8_21_14_0_10_32_10]
MFTKSHVYKKLIIVAMLTLFTAFGLKASLVLQNKESKLKTPKNIQVLNIEEEVNTDICKQYEDNNNKNISETKPTNVQKIIGYQNNKFGLYIYRVDDFARIASELVNSNGGDWGYVLVPYNVRDYDTTKWNSFFDVLNEYHLIPIIQLWDVSKDPNDAIKETKRAAEYLNSLNWPIKNRYISVYNEVNDERFWKNGIDPEGYAILLNETIDIFKSYNDSFFILNGAFNASAKTGIGYLDEEVYLKRMNNQINGIFAKLDGWASHPYPHINGYLGTPEDTGRTSIRAYEWELSILEKNFNVKNLPVFITETGWPHAEGERYNAIYISQDKAAEYIKSAFENIWLKDTRVVAVTPFTIKYDPPFDYFSWIKKDGTYYKQFYTIKDIPKEKGMPPLVGTYDPLKKKCEELNRK